MKSGLLHHIEIYVSDLAVSAEFWGWFLGEMGYHEFQRWPSGVSFKLEDTYLVFVQTTEKHRSLPYNRCATGLNHLAFHAESKSQIDNIKKVLEARGSSILYPERYPHAGGLEQYALYFEDPDRIKIELISSMS